MFDNRILYISKDILIMNCILKIYMMEKYLFL